MAELAAWWGMLMKRREQGRGLGADEVGNPCVRCCIMTGGQLGRPPENTVLLRKCLEEVREAPWGLRWGSSRWQGPEVGLCPAWWGERKLGAARKGWGRRGMTGAGLLRFSEDCEPGRVGGCWKVLSGAVAWSPISVENEPQEGGWKQRDELGDTGDNQQSLSGKRVAVYMLFMVCNVHILSELGSNDQRLKLPRHFTVYLGLGWHR